MLLDRTFYPGEVSEIRSVSGITRASLLCDDGETVEIDLDSKNADECVPTHSSAFSLLRYLLVLFTIYTLVLFTTPLHIKPCS